MSERVNGTPVVFGLVGTTITGLTGFLVEANQGLRAKLATAADEGGVEQAHVFYDPSADAELVFDVKGATLSAAYANASLTPWAPGTFIQISAAPRRPDLVATNWEVTEAGPRMPGRNTELARITIPLSKRDSITSAAPA